MRRIACFVLLALQTGIASAQHRLPPPIHEAVLAGLDRVFRQEYSAADSIFASLSQHAPDHPAGPLYEAAVLQSRSIDLGVPLDRSRFDSLLTAGRERCERLRPTSDGVRWKEFFEATADGYDAVARVDAGDWFGGIRKGMSSASAFERIIDADSGFADAYTGPGAYFYWKTRKTQFLQWLPFVSDTRPKGITMLERGYQNGEYNRWAAVSSLVAVFLDAGDHPETLRWSRIGLAVYPQNRIFRWGLATALHHQGSVREAAAAYDTLLTEIRTAASSNPYDEIVCRLNLVRCRLAASDTTAVAAHLDAILSHEHTVFPGRYADRVPDKFEEARRLRAQVLPPR